MRRQHVMSNADIQPLLLELDTGPIALIHRKGKGFVPFQSKDGEKWKLLFAPQTDQIENLLEECPAAAPFLVTNAYYGINTMFCTRPWVHKETGLPTSKRAERLVTHLNCVFADIDCGRPDDSDEAKRMDWNDVVASINKRVEAGELPPVSMFARSGRGVYAIWLLRADDTEETGVPYHPNIYPERLAIYKATGKAIGELLRNGDPKLAADEKTHDAARVIRVPGSINTRAEAGENRVKYWIAASASGKRYYYTLGELAQWFGVPMPKSSLPLETRRIVEDFEPEEIVEAYHEYREEADAEVYGRPIQNRGTRPAGVNGAKKVNAMRAQDLCTIEAICGGWRHGTRNFRLRLYAQFLRGAGNDKLSTLHAVEQMASSCRSRDGLTARPYPTGTTDPPVSGIVTAVFNEPMSAFFYTSEKCCEFLGVTSEMAREHNLLTIIPDDVRAEREQRIREQPSPREANQQERHELIKQHIEQGGDPSRRAICSALAAQGIEITDRTISNDLKALGITEKGKAGRPQKVKEPTLFEPSELAAA